MKKNGTLKISNNLLIITSVGRNDTLKNTHTIIFRKFWAFELFFFEGVGEGPGRRREGGLHRNGHR